ncbi:MmpS family transport accessory protein [uncultured Mucilaginibacter sp.]|uniref:MmpS family transport accessory protein n=1 Tax=uncultured Mucilaginibacter sp. TaxID=797541 RepID=UPI0025DC7FC6|nr:MmpS family transport accessory protein [uncultured Mucilaginibacter sp.]
MKKIIFFSLLILITVVTFSCKKNNSHVVKYTIQGTAKSTVTYTDQNGNTQTVTNADASWTTSFASTEHGIALKLTVISIDGSNVGGKIFIDGNQTAQNNGNSSNVSITATLP